MPAQVAFAQHVTSRPVRALADLQTDQVRVEPAHNSGRAENLLTRAERIAVRSCTPLLPFALSRSCEALHASMETMHASS